MHVSFRPVSFVKNNWPIILVLLTPLGMLVAHGSVFDPFKLDGYIDPWLYTGLSNSPRYLLKFYPGAYYVSRIPWTLPYYILNQILHPLTASYVIHALFFYMGILSTFGTVRRLLGPVSAVIAAWMMAFYALYWWSMGWDYVNFPATNFTAFCLYCITSASYSRRWRWWLILSGASAIAAILTYTVTVGFVILILIFGAYLNWQRGNRSWPQSFLLLLLGAVTCVVALAVSAHFLTGQSLLFFLPQLRAAVLIAKDPGPWKSSTYAWVYSAWYLELPLTIYVMSAIHLIIHNKHVRNAFKQVNLNDPSSVPDMRLALTTALIFLYFLAFSGFLLSELSGFWLLQLSYYTLFLSVLLFPAIGALIFYYVENIHKNSWRPMLTCILCAISLVAMFRINPPSLWQVIPVTTIAIFVLPIILTNKRLSFVGIILIATLGVNYPGSFINDDAGYRFVAQDALISLQAHVTNKPFFFWFNRNENYVYNNIASALFWAHISDIFSADPLVPTSPITQGQYIVIMSEVPDAITVANTSLNATGLQFCTHAIDLMEYPKGQNWRMIYGYLELRTTNCPP